MIFPNRKRGDASVRRQAHAVHDVPLAQGDANGPLPPQTREGL